MIIERRSIMELNLEFIVHPAPRIQHGNSRRLVPCTLGATTYGTTEGARMRDAPSLTARAGGGNASRLNQGSAIQCPANHLRSAGYVRETLIEYWNCAALCSAVPEIGAAKSGCEADASGM